MKKSLLRIVLIIILLGLGFWLNKKYFVTSPIVIPVDTGSVQSTGLTFINDAWFVKTPLDRNSIIADPTAVGGKAEIEACKKNPKDFAMSCEDMQKELDAFVLADYIFTYSGFTVYVLDTSKSSWHLQTITDWLQEFSQTGTFPNVTIRKILTDTIFMNRSVIDKTRDLFDIKIQNADTSRAFISFEWQDAHFPTLNIIFKKWEYLVRISNILRSNRSNPVDMSPALVKTFQAAYDKEMALVAKDPEGKLNIDNFMKDFSEIMQNPEYSTLLGKTVNNALSWFAIK